MQKDELVVCVEEALGAMPDVSFTRAADRPYFILGDLGSITPRWDARRGRPELQVETFPSDGLEQTTMPFDALSPLATGATVGEAVDWLKTRHAQRGESA